MEQRERASRKNANNVIFWSGATLVYRQNRQTFRIHRRSNIVFSNIFNSNGMYFTIEYPPNLADKISTNFPQQRKPKHQDYTSIMSCYVSSCRAVLHRVASHVIA